MKEKICEAIDDRKEEIISIGRKILESPELGYKEMKTAALVKQRFRDMGLEYTDGLALTGVKARINGRANKPTVAVLGELDALPLPDHSFADPKTGAAHACGHNAQIANLLGVGMGLIDLHAMKILDGSVELIAVPAEEFIDIEGKKKLIDLGKIRFSGGKQELIRRGELDSIDLAISVHASPNTPQRKVRVGCLMNCFLEDS